MLLSAHSVLLLSVAGSPDIYSQIKPLIKVLKVDFLTVSFKIYGENSKICNLHPISLHFFITEIVIKNGMTDFFYKIP